ncbi:hypothetical protein DYB30_009403 [Aphanomyces astaci]|uniref:Protein kinase domain-containing protein n=1 Tax=Aphanomyces astaci TaxID=112090 RepID=A0A397E901_APHAT|nr:hypothetical protein DYB30_009403 [Aphanomyces astaci]
MLHNAAANGYLDIVAALWPGANLLSQRRGKLLLEYVAPYLTLDGLVLMLAKDLPIIIVNNLDANTTNDQLGDPRVVPNPDHRYSWAAFLDPSTITVNDAIAKEAVASAIFDLVAKDMRIPREVVVRALVTTSTDQHGRPVLSVADPFIAAFLMGQLYFANRYEIADGPPVHVSATSVVNDDDMMTTWTKAFELWDSDPADDDAGSGGGGGGGGLSSHTFRRYCDQTYGVQLHVALKFMKLEDSYRREISQRRHVHAKYILPLLPSFTLDDDDVASPTTTSHHVTCSSVGNGQTLSLADYPHVVAMPAGDRTLHDILVKERPGRGDIQAMLLNVAQCLAHLHGCGIVHGDVKALNVLRVHHQLKLIDLDAATPVGEFFQRSTCTSGILPPEMFVHLDTTTAMRQHYEAYCRQAGDATGAAAMWRQHRPRSGYVVRLDPVADSQPSQRNNSVELPYALIPMSPSMDIWAFGCLVYLLVTGLHLVTTDIHLNIPAEYMAIAATWTDLALDVKLEANVDDIAARDLLRRLLRVDPAHRISMAAALEHPYFTAQTCDNVSLDDGGDEAFCAIEEKKPPTVSHIPDKIHVHAACDYDDIALKCREPSPSLVVETSPLVTPTQVTNEGLEAEQCRSHPTLSTQNTMLLDHDPHLTRPHPDESSPSFVLLPMSRVHAIPFVGNDAAIWTSFVSHFHSTCHAVAAAMAAGLPIDAPLKQLNHGHSLYLYLLDDVTGDLVPSTTATTSSSAASSSVYPIEIRPTDLEFLAMSLPLALAGLATFSRHHQQQQRLLLTVAGNRGPLADGIVATTTSTSTTTSATTSLPEIQSVTFGAMWRAIRGDSAVTPLHVRQAILHAVTRWFHARDPRHTFGGLTRTWTEHGDVVWTAKVEELVILATQETKSQHDDDRHHLTMQKILRQVLASGSAHNTDMCDKVAPPVPIVATSSGASCSPDQCVVM